MADPNIEIFLLKMKIENQTQRIHFLTDKNCDLKKQLSESKDVQQNLFCYLFNEINRQEELQRELYELKLLFLQIDLVKRKKELELKKEIEQIKWSLQNLSLS